VTPQLKLQRVRRWQAVEAFTTWIPLVFLSFLRISQANASKEDLRRLFVSFGKVEEVFIPNKLDRWGKRFGFVKFKEVVDEVEVGGGVVVAVEV